MVKRQRGRPTVVDATNVQPEDQEACRFSRNGIATRSDSTRYPKTIISTS